MLILVDAMGGDHAPAAVVNGCLDAVQEKDGFDVLLIGDQEKISKIMQERKFSSDRIKIHHTTEVVTMEDSPTKAIRGKKDSSMVVGFKLLKEKQGDVFVSAGNTGALLAGALLILGRIKGVDRPALAPVLPTKEGIVLLADAGANTVCKPVNHLQFGIMGSIYMRDVFGIKSPKVGLINVGSEDTKGNDTIKQAFDLLSKANINFTGNVEAHQVTEGKVDVAVCDGFVGNVFLKTVEGVASFLIGELKGIFKKNWISMGAAILVSGGLKKLKKKTDISEYGSVPFLGVNGKVMKTHGRSDAKAIKYSIFAACNYAKSSILDEIRDEFKNMEVEEIEQGT
ncbi:MAG: phosphate acyltransferase PlsX [Clostridia bacterium]|nr:phosphate acyltransferase PlsX [Clostridia bacterium]